MRQEKTAFGEQKMMYVPVTLLSSHCIQGKVFSVLCIYEKALSFFYFPNFLAHLVMIIIYNVNSD